MAVPVHDGRPHFHHAVWHRRALPAIERAFADGERAPRRVAATLTVVEVPVGSGGVLDDVDDPAAYQAAYDAAAKAARHRPNS